MSLKYQDSAANEWSLKLTVDIVDHIKEGTGIDLLGKPDESEAAFKKIMGDVRILMNVVWHIVEPQAKALGLSLLDFHKAIDGDTIEKMADTMANAIADFSPTHLRELLLAGWAKGKESQEATTRAAKSAMAKTDMAKMEAGIEAKTRARIDKELTALLNHPESSSTKSPESLASSPAP